MKFGLKQVVQSSPEDYESTVAPLDPRYVSLRRWSVVWRDWAAIACRLVQPARQGEYPTLADRVVREDCTPKDESLLIGAIFDGLKPWHAAYSQEEPHQAPKRLVEYWMASLWTDSRNAIKRLHGIHDDFNPQNDEKLVVYLNGEQETIDDAVRFLLRRQHDADAVKLITTCVVHGDLHARNILVVGREPCIIDCARVSDGHPLHDFATLETSIRFDAIYSGKLFEDVWRLETRLVDPFFEPSWKEFDDPGWKGKAVRLTHAIRYRAWLLKPSGESVERWREQYALCLFFCLLKEASIAKIPGVVWPDRRKLAYYAAGKLVGLAATCLNKQAATAPGTAEIYKEKEESAGASRSSSQPR